MSPQRGYMQSNAHGCFQCSNRKLAWSGDDISNLDSSLKCRVMSVCVACYSFLNCQQQKIIRALLKLIHKGCLAQAHAMTA